MREQLRTALQAKDCTPEQGLALLEVVNSLSGKWKMVLICVIGQDELRFMELQKLLPAITPRMLSKELKELELNGLITKAVQAEPAVTYSLTPSAQALVVLIRQLVDWGAQHRKQSMGR